jgi:preprotein translocase subunit SecG
MFTFVITLIIIVSLLLMLVVLAQSSKGSGVSSQFGGSTTSQVIGVKKTGSFLEKMTWTLAILLMALSLSTNLLIDRSQSNVFTSPNIEKAQETTIMPSLPMEEQNGGEQEQAPAQQDTAND